MTQITIEEIAENYPGLFDPFGNVRVGTERNRLDIEFIYDKQPWLVEDVSAGNGSATHQANPRDVLLAVGGTDGADVGGLRTKTWVPYTPGAGQVITFTGVLDSAGIGGGTAQVFLRTTVSGSTVTNTYDLTNWQAFGSTETYALDFSRSHIFAVDFQSLKVGTIHYGLVRNGVMQRIYTIHNDNVRASGYWQYASLPLYWKIYNSGANTVAEFGYGDDANGVGFRYVFASVNASATATAICGTVKSSNGLGIEDLPGFSLSVDNGVTEITASTTLVPILSIRVAATVNSIANRGLYLPQEYSILTTNPTLYRLLYRPTLTGPSWTAVNATYSGMEYDVTASAVTGGIVVGGGYLSAGVNRSAEKSGLLDRVTMSLGASADILTIAAIRTGTSDSDVLASLRWKEIR